MEIEKWLRKANDVLSSGSGGAAKTRRLRKNAAKAQSQTQMLLAAFKGFLNQQGGTNLAPLQELFKSMQAKPKSVRNGNVQTRKILNQLRLRRYESGITRCMKFALKLVGGNGNGLRPLQFQLLPRAPKPSEVVMPLGPSLNS